MTETIRAEDATQAAADEGPASPHETRLALLQRAGRRFAVIRHEFVQRPTELRGTRGGPLASLVSTHDERALDAYLLMLGSAPFLERGIPLPAPVWARALSEDPPATPCPVPAVSRVWSRLSKLQLITRERMGRAVAVRPLREDGSGATYTRPYAPGLPYGLPTSQHLPVGDDAASPSSHGPSDTPSDDHAVAHGQERGSGPAKAERRPDEPPSAGGRPRRRRGQRRGLPPDAYFTLPHEFWTDSWDQKLSLPGKALLLIALHATSTQPRFYLPYDQGPAWYGLSSETVERGLRELRREGLLQEHPERIKAPLAPLGWTTRFHYEPTGPFSTRSRDRLRRATAEEVAARLVATSSKEEGR